MDVIVRLQRYLVALEGAEHVPRLDIQWLRLRCDDTIGYRGQLQVDSMRQLRAEVADFDAEHPGLLPPALVVEFRA